MSIQMSTMTRADFRLLNMECCWSLICWVNPRLPTYCPNCGNLCWPAVKGWVTYRDEQAYIVHREDKL